MYSTSAGANEFLERLNMYRENARLAIARAQEKQARSHNKGRRFREFEVGEQVLVNPHTLEWAESKGEGAKLVQRWIGPFEISEKLNPKTYRLRMSNRYPGSPIFNQQHLRHYASSPQEFGERTSLPETRTAKPADEEYEVETIIGHRQHPKTKKYEFLLRWKGFTPLFDSWEPEKNLKNAPHLIREYKERTKFR